MSESVVSAKEELERKVWKAFWEKGKLLSENLPDPALDRYYELNSIIEMGKETLLTNNEEQLEKIRVWEREGGLDNCPISFPIEEGIPEIPDEPLKELCTDTRCPDFEKCWATKQLTPPTEHVLNFYEIRREHPFSINQELNGEDENV